MKRILLAAAANAMLLSSTAAVAAKTDDGDAGSLYLRCDGKPNNMSDGESFARLLGAITLLGLFAPAREEPDPSKRLFAEEGVDACSQLIDGEKAEGNAVRRIPLILARALHQIEAKNYEAALVDVDLARDEAAAANLAGNPYFDRSMGLSFANIEAETRLRMGDPAGAQSAVLARHEGMKYSFVPSLVLRDYNSFLRDFSPEAEAKLAASARVMPSLLHLYSAKLEEVGRFGDAAQKLEALIELIDAMRSEDENGEKVTGSWIYARVALSHALAGNWERADSRASFARANMAKRRAEGKPEENAVKIVELLDLYDIIKQAHEGDVAAARRSFAARSQWVEPSFGSVIEVNRRLREGASEEELFGSLAIGPEEMWQKRYEEAMAVRLQKDTENKSLFSMIQSYAKVDEFEGRSKETWRTEKSKMMGKEADDRGFWVISQGGNLYSAVDSVLLHAALQAKARGKEGFVIYVSIPTRPTYYLSTMGWAKFVDRGERLGNDVLFIDADDVIAELSPMIPDYEELKKRKRRR